MTQKKAILCVDDDVIVTNALRSLFTIHFGQQHIIEIAQSAEEALEIVSEFKSEGIELQVVLADYIMPGICGDELLIKIHDLHPQTVTIMLTGQSDVSGVKKAINDANLYRFIEKPWQNDDLILTTKGAITTFENENKLECQNIALEEMNKTLEEKVAQRTSELQENNTKLEKALADVKVLSGILPICSCCKNIRDSKGYWSQVEEYVSKHSDAQFSHGMCDSCAEKNYGDKKWFQKYKANKSDEKN